MKRVSLIETCVQFVTPLAILVAFFFFFRGHNAPGGGFIGGLVMAIAFVLYAIAFDVDKALRIMPSTLERLFSLGLALATLTGVGAIILGYPFLTSAHGYVNLGPLGTMHLVTTILFDLGVFLVVISVVAGMVFQFAMQKCEIEWPVPQNENTTFDLPRGGPLLKLLKKLTIAPVRGRNNMDWDIEESEEEAPAPASTQPGKAKPSPAPQEGRP